MTPHGKETGGRRHAPLLPLLKSQKVKKKHQLLHLHSNIFVLCLSLRFSLDLLVVAVCLLTNDDDDDDHAMMADATWKFSNFFLKSKFLRRSSSPGGGETKPQGRALDEEMRMTDRLQTSAANRTG